MKTQVKTKKKRITKKFVDEFTGILNDLGFDKAFIKTMDKKWSSKSSFC